MNASPPPGEAEAPLRKAPVSEELACPRCRTSYEPAQEYCLECGLRLPLPATGVVASLGGAWRRRLAWYPGDWVWPTMLALVVAVLGGLGADFFAKHDQTSAPATVARTVATEQVTTATTPPPPERTTSTTTPRKSRAHAKPKPKPATVLTAWPSGRSGWTVVLLSTLTRPAALEQARKARSGGLTGVGVLDSSRYSSLHPGYFVVFSGVYDNETDTRSGLATARSKRYLSSYARRITP